MGKRSRKRFVELLQCSRDVTASTTYKAAARLLGSNAAWEAVDETTRKQCFDVFVDQLKLQKTEREASEDRRDRSDRPEKKGKWARDDPEPPTKKASRKERRRDESSE